MDCPRCGSSRVQGYGNRPLKYGEKTQRLKCTACGATFSEKYIRCIGPRKKHQICVSKKAKNLDTIPETKTVMVDIENKLKEYHVNMKINGYKEATIHLSWSILDILEKRGADLLQPQSVKKVISEQNWSDNRRRNVINAYSKFVKYLGLSWKEPLCKVTRKLPFIPTAEEINELIAGAGLKFQFGEQ